MLVIFAQSASDTLPAWAGNLTAPAMMGVLLYYVMTKMVPTLQAAIQASQERFQEQLKEERDCRERIIEKMFTEHRESLKSIIDKDEKRYEILCVKFDKLPCHTKPAL